MLRHHDLGAVAERGHDETNANVRSSQYRGEESSDPVDEDGRECCSAISVPLELRSCTQSTFPIIDGRVSKPGACGTNHSFYLHYPVTFDYCVFLRFQ